MIGMMLRMAGAPVQMMLCGAAAAAICGCFACLSCRRCSCRDLACVKWFLRSSGHDPFDEFELLVQVHEASFESRKSAKTFVRFTAGQQVVSTAKSKKGNFQEVLCIIIEQGTTNLVVDLLMDGGALLANLKLDIVKDVIAATQESSKVYHLNQKERGVLNPMLTLTLSAGGSDAGSAELDNIAAELLDGEDMETAFLMKKHLAAVHRDVASENKKESYEQGMRVEGVNAADTEMLEVLARAACGPIEVFQGFGSAQKQYFNVTGPPKSRHFSLGTWNKQEDVDDGKPSVMEIDLLRIESVHADPNRTDVFHLSYLDKNKLAKTKTCRIVDRPTTVWVETISLLITRIRNIHSQQKKDHRESKKKSEKVRQSAKSSTAPKAEKTSKPGLFSGFHNPLKKA